MARRRRLTVSRVLQRVVTVVQQHPWVEPLRRQEVVLPPTLEVDTPADWTVLSGNRITTADGRELIDAHLASRVGIQWGLWDLASGHLLTGLHRTGMCGEETLVLLGLQPGRSTTLGPEELQALPSLLRLADARWTPPGVSKPAGVFGGSS